MALVEWVYQHAVGAIIGGIVADLWSLTAALEVAAGLSLLSGLVVAVRMYETHPPGARTTDRPGDLPSSDIERLPALWPRRGSAGDISEGSVTTDRPRRFFSRFYARISPGMEDQGMAELRQEMLAGLHGRVVEIGPANGLNFAHYPSTVTEVVAVEPEPFLRELAVQAARQAPVPITVVPGRAERLPMADHSVDAAVVCLVLCSVLDREQAIHELRRVVRPDGNLRFLEHCIADTPGLRRVQRLADATIWPLLTGGCHTATNPVAALEDKGFTITAVRRLRFPEHRISLPATPHVLGRARPVANHDRI